MAIINDMKKRYGASSMVMRIIYINIAFFVVLRVLGIIMFLFNINTYEWLKWVEVSSNPEELLMSPWTVFTYAFAHYDILHILFNMLWFYWLARIFMEYFNSKQLVMLYVLGAVGGVVLYELSMNLLPAFSDGQYRMIGASASVLAIVAAMAVYAPDYKISLLFIGSISLKWIALGTLLIDFLSIDISNAGGHIAHIGGAMVGALFGLMMRRGHDITSPLNAFVDWCVSLFQRRKRPSVGDPVGGRSYRKRTPNNGSGTQKHNESAQTTAPCEREGERELDEILAKLKRSGYTALTEHERNVLFSYSNKKKN